MVKSVNNFRQFTNSADQGAYTNNTMPNTHKCYPHFLSGMWKRGYALGLHTYKNSEDRTPIGDALYKFKYGENSQKFMKNMAGKSLANTAVKFIKDKHIDCDIIVPVPPSNKSRITQPVPTLANWIGQQLSWRVADCVQHKINTKNISIKEIHPEDRSDYLRGMFEVTGVQLRDRNVLLIDDIYDTGATAHEVTDTLLRAGAKSVSFLAMAATKKVYDDKYSSSYDSDSFEDYDVTSDDSDDEDHDDIYPESPDYTSDYSID